MCGRSGGALDAESKGLDSEVEIQREKGDRHIVSADRRKEQRE